MKVGNEHFRSIWLAADGKTVRIIDQTRLPHEFAIIDLTNLDQVATAIRDMWVRGAPLIGATAAYGMALAMREDASDAGISRAVDMLGGTRPTAVNLRWALEDMATRLTPLAHHLRIDAAYRRAAEVSDEDIAMNSAIGDQGVTIIEAISKRKNGAAVNILTHCNAGWLATVDWGTATSPIYKAVAQGIDVHVWVDETRPRNQGAHLTAWEMAGHGIPHHLIVDNAGGHLMQHGMVDVVIVGTDRTTATGDVCNKIGTYLKALAAFDNNVPFYVALPSPTIDWRVDNGIRDIPIEERNCDEVSYVQGKNTKGEVMQIRISPETSPASNPAFDVTPSRLITGLITERGIVKASREGLVSLFPEKTVM